MPIIESIEEKKSSKAIDLVMSKFTNIVWCIQKDVDSVQEQEKMFIQLLKLLSKYDNITKIAENLLDIEKQLKLKEIQEEKDEEDTVTVVAMFEDLSVKKE